MVVGIIFLLSDKKDIALSSLPHDIRAGLVVLLVIFILVVIVSLLGLIGTTKRNRKLVRIYSWMVWIITIIQIAGEVFLIYTLFIRKCHDEVIDGLEFQCISVPVAAKVVLLVVSLVLLAIQIYVAVVIRSYDKQLQDEEQLHREYIAYNTGAFNLNSVEVANEGVYTKIPNQDYDF
ncbi:hypothetical protein Clacol_007157 [Clathrus columnatus]|uniref:Uncharacterized protein n=1 Tax=Clathrus columnatus TaxID=1419009 RepID=A0AAV5AJ06_9AGAM|nr:hypothetical protein Clacol_007157 [Clathrus columnatus]